MTANDFCFWLTGYTELGGGPPTPEQWEVIKEHLGLVFTKVTTKTVASTAADALTEALAKGGSKLCVTTTAALPNAPTYCVSKTLDAMKAKEERPTFNLTGYNGPMLSVTC